MTIIQMRGAREAPKSERSSMETLLLTPEIVSQWVIPPFQRPLRVNAKVIAIAEELKHNQGIVEGVISLGEIGGDRTRYLYDGQHRIEAARISGLSEFIADVRIRRFNTMGEMAVEFWRLNTPISRMRPDDTLRALEGSIDALQIIRANCPFIGYENIRRNAASPTLSMSAAIRCWAASTTETPNLTGSGKSAAELAQSMTSDDANALVQFLGVARQAWGADLAYSRLWGNLNLTVCMWLWRRLVLDQDRGVKRSVLLNSTQFKQCLMSVSAGIDYLDWLVSRTLNDRERGPCLTRLKALFTRRLREEGFAKPKLPSPAWASD